MKIIYRRKNISFRQSDFLYIGRVRVRGDTCEAVGRGFDPRYHDLEMEEPPLLRSIDPSLIVVAS